MAASFSLVSDGAIRDWATGLSDVVFLSDYDAGHDRLLASDRWGDSCSLISLKRATEAARAIGGNGTLDACAIIQDEPLLIAIAACLG